MNPSDPPLASHLGPAKPTPDVRDRLPADPVFLGDALVGPCGRAGDPLDRLDLIDRQLPPDRLTSDQRQ